MRIAMTWVAMLALTACGEAPQQPERKAQPVAETGAAAQVAQLSEQQRNGVLAKAIRASGAIDCLTVTESERASMMNGAPGWKAQCDNGKAHLIEILADGTAKVTSRSN